MSAYKNALSALARYTDADHLSAQYISDESDIATSRKHAQSRQKVARKSKIADMSDTSDDQLDNVRAGPNCRRHLLNTYNRRGRPRNNRQFDSSSERLSSATSQIVRRQHVRSTGTRSARADRGPRPNYKELPLINDFESEISDDELLPSKRRNLHTSKTKTSRSDHGPERLEFQVEGIRRSSRARRQVDDMHEVEEDYIPEVTIGRGLPNVTGAKEHFQELAKDNEFRLRHNLTCST